MTKIKVKKKKTHAHTHTHTHNFVLVRSVILKETSNKNKSLVLRGEGFFTRGVKGLWGLFTSQGCTPCLHYAFQRGSTLLGVPAFLNKSKDILQRGEGGQWSRFKFTQLLHISELFILNPMSYHTYSCYNS